MPAVRPLAARLPMRWPVSFLVCAAVLGLLAAGPACARGSDTHSPPPLALRQQNGGLQGDGGSGTDRPSTAGANGSGSDVSPNIPPLSFTDQAMPWQYKAPYSTDGNVTASVSGGGLHGHTPDTVFSPCDLSANQLVSPETRINISAVYAHVNPSNHTPSAPAQGELKIVALGSINARTQAVKNGSHLVSTLSVPP